MSSFFNRFARLAALAACLLAAPPAPAQAPTDAPPPPAAQPTGAPPAPTEPKRVRTSEMIEQAKNQLDEVTAALRGESLDDATLSHLRDRLEPAKATVMQAIERLTPLLASAKERVDKLGPKPDAKGPAEGADVAAAREQETQRYKRIEERLKRAQVLALQIDQTSDRIVSRRRALFVNALFTRSYSLASPSLWIAAGRSAPQDLRAIAGVGADFIDNAAQQLEGWRLPAFLALAAILGLLNIPLYRYVRGVLRREPTVAEPGRLRMALGACWTAIVVAVPPLVTLFALLALFDAFDLTTTRILPLRRALLEGVARVAILAGAARGLFAPSRQNWRLIAISDASAARLSRLAIALPAIVAVASMVEALTDIIGSPLSTTAVVQGLGALLFAAVLAGGVYGLGANDDSDEECLGPRVIPRPRWIGLVRLATWAVIAAIGLALLSGYIPVASFLSEQFVWSAGVVIGLSLLIPLVASAIEAGFQPSSHLGRTMTSSVGVRREGVTQLGIVLAGLAQLLLPTIGLIAIVAPWGLQSDDLLGGLRNAYYGFKIGGVTISLSSVLVALVLFAVGYTITRAIQRWLDKKFMPATNLDAGLRNSIRTSVGYVGLFLAAAAALAQVGLGFQQIALVAGALSVGIGFGLQSVVNNFVSGLILLWERSIRVGDWIVVGDEQGYVRKINVRATEIETFDRSTVIVPNSNLISGVVKNWLRQDRVGRVNVNVTLNTDVDPEQVREIMNAAARAHESISKIPAPATMFTGMSAGGLTFDLYCFVDDVAIAFRTGSDLRYQIFKAFKEAGVAVGPPQSLAHVALQGAAVDAVAELTGGAGR